MFFFDFSSAEVCEFLFFRYNFMFFPSVFLRTVDGRNPKQPPGMSKTMEIIKFQLPTSSGEFTRCFLTINSMLLIFPFLLGVACFIPRNLQQDLLNGPLNLSI